MNEFDSLKSLRSAVPQRSLDDLAPSYAQLSRVMHAEERAAARSSAAASPSRRVWLRERFTPKLVRWSTAAAAFALTAGIVGAQVLTSADPASAAEILHQAAQNAIKYSDLEVGEGQYLKIVKYEDSPTSYDSVTHEFTRGFIPRVYAYAPGDVDAEWVYQLRKLDTDGVETDDLETEKSLGGFMDSGLQATLAAIPTQSAAETLEYFDAQYTGASLSRDEDNFTRIMDLLTTGAVGAETRAALLNALALIPGVEASPKTTNELGEVAYGFSRSEEKRSGETTEVLISPETGLIVGEHTSTASGERTFSMAMTYEVVDSAP